MRRTLLAAVLVVAAVAPAATVAATASEPKPAIVGVSVAPTPAFVDESVTVAPTIVNDASATGDFEINAVALRTTRGDRLREYTRIENVGTLSPGESVRVPFELSFGEPGTKRFTAVVYGEDASGNTTRLEYPVTAEVRDAHPAVRVDVDRQLTAGVTESLNVAVSNGFGRELRDVTVEFDSAELATAPAEAGTARLQPGEERTFEFRMQAPGPRSDVVEITLRYRTSTGLVRETSVVKTLEFAPMREDVTLDATAPPAGQFTVPVTVGNFGNAPLEDVVVRATASNGTVSPVAVGRVPPGTTRQVELRVDGVETRASVDITATYEFGGETHARTAQTVVRSIPAGQIELTGLDVTRENGRLHVVGSAANVGLDAVDSVIVRVVDTPNVDPAAPNREYFVGTVPASDFVSFDVYATAEGNVSSIPLAVTYLADGERRTVRARVPYDAEPDPERSATDAGIGLPVYAAGGVVALVVLGLIGVGWYNRGG